jgi:hypothetical protein
MMVMVEMGNKTHSQKIDDATAVVKSKNYVPLPDLQSIS